MTPDQIRESYLSFFEERGHTRYSSDSLVPENDPTLLFTGAGMNQFKAMFMGKGNLPFQRATTSQKCLRMPDLENVGRTASHHTFFEMLGNFSFGDYFKQEAITWAYEWLLAMGIPAERLSVTVFTDDDEATDIWADGAGLPRDRIYRCGEDENFWPASAPSKGPNGICGPCSEIYFDFAPEQGAIPAEGPATDGKRFVEIWNLVFTQFEREDGGHLKPLPNRNIDTGAGFERLVRVIESLERGEVLPSNFETALFAPILSSVHEHVGQDTTFGSAEGTRVRRIVDHVRAASFCIADGVRPSNLKQGYVVRKILRRAMLDRHVLGADLRSPWLSTLSDTVVETMGSAWPQLRDAQKLIASTIASEEERFASAFLSGSQRLHTMVESAREQGGSTLSGADAFLLYDTFGLPLDLQHMLLDEHGFDVDEEAFRAAMAEQRRRSREGSRISDAIFDEGPLAAVSESLPPTEFLRGDGLDADAQLLAVVDDGADDADEPSSEAAGRRVILVLDRTPFYAEGGGQVGDAGVIEGEAFRVEIDDTVSLRGIFLHRGVVISGEPAAGAVRASVDGALRASTERNHTATHLLHGALRSVLGEEVTQAGSLVAPDRLRFDFRFPRAMTRDEIDAVETMVNEWVLANQDVQAREMSRDDARQQGAMALFGEKYGEVVRVVRVPDPGGAQDSVELCGGTHVNRSGDIGLLRIASEASIAAGVRRIEARTGQGVLTLVRSQDELLRTCAALFKTSPESLQERISALQGELKSTRRDLNALRDRTARDQLSSAVRDWRGLKILVTVVHGIPLKTLREMSSDFLGEGCDLVMLAAPDGASTGFLAATGDGARTQGLQARALVAALSEALGGKGGGSASFAQGKGGSSPDLAAVLDRVLETSAGTLS
jgi:alanyl-tRNA synthetase